MRRMSRLVAVGLAAVMVVNIYMTPRANAFVAETAAMSYALSSALSLYLGTTGAAYQDKINADLGAYLDSLGSKILNAYLDVAELSLTAMYDLVSAGMSITANGLVVLSSSAANFLRDMVEWWTTTNSFDPVIAPNTSVMLYSGNFTELDGSKVYAIRYSTDNPNMYFTPPPGSVDYKTLVAPYMAVSYDGWVGVPSFNSIPSSSDQTVLSSLFNADTSFQVWGTEGGLYSLHACPLVFASSETNSSTWVTRVTKLYCVWLIAFVNGSYKALFGSSYQIPQYLVTEYQDDFSTSTTVADGKLALNPGVTPYYNTSTYALSLAPYYDNSNYPGAHYVLGSSSYAALLQKPSTASTFSLSQVYIKPTESFAIPSALSDDEVLTLTPSVPALTDTADLSSALAPSVTGQLSAGLAVPYAVTVPEIVVDWDEVPVVDDAYTDADITDGDYPSSNPDPSGLIPGDVFAGFWHYILELLAFAGEGLSVIGQVFDALPYALKVVYYAIITCVLVFGLLSRLLM